MQFLNFLFDVSFKFNQFTTYTGAERFPTDGEFRNLYPRVNIREFSTYETVTMVKINSFELSREFNKNVLCITNFFSMLR